MANQAERGEGFNQGRPRDIIPDAMGESHEGFLTRIRKARGDKDYGLITDKQREGVIPRGRRARGRRQ